MMTRAYPWLHLKGTMSGPIRAKGTTDDLQLAMNLEGPAGKLSYNGRVDIYPLNIGAHGTGHAEAVEVTFDPARTSYEQLLDAFWANHDPTTMNRQGADAGSNYRSAIFFHSSEQEAVALRSKHRLEESARFRRPIVTEIVPAGTFWDAEDYHQRYYSRRGMAAACRL